MGLIPWLLGHEANFLTTVPHHIITDFPPIPCAYFWVRRYFFRYNWFPTTLCRDWESNSRWQSCNFSRDLLRALYLLSFTAAASEHMLVVRSHCKLIATINHQPNSWFKYRFLQSQPKPLSGQPPSYRLPLSHASFTASSETSAEKFKPGSGTSFPARALNFLAIFIHGQTQK